MELANQILYLSFMLVFVGLAFVPAQELRPHGHIELPKLFWLVALAAMSLSCLALLLYQNFGEIALSLRVGFQIISNISLVLLFRSFNKNLTKQELIPIFIAIPILFGIDHFVRSTNLYETNVALASGFGIAITIWQIYELGIRYIKSKSIYIGFIIVACLSQIFFWIYRILIVEDYSDPINHLTLFDEHLPEFLARLMLVVLYALIFISVGNYFNEQKVNLEKQRRKEKENQMLFALTKLAVTKDNDTGNHMVRTQNYVKQIAERLVKLGYFTEQLSQQNIEALYRAAPLHDIGKVGIPDHVLLKPDRLDPQERKIMDTHVEIGESVLLAARGQITEHDPVIESAIKIAGGHHEKWDGSGYPRGLKGEAIPLEARIMSVADMYDALTTERPYKKAWSHEQAVTEIIKNKAMAFDPAVVEAFLAEQDTFRAIAQKYKD